MSFPESLVDASSSFPLPAFNAEPRLIFESIHHPMRCNPETTPSWEPIAAALTRGQKWTRAAGVDWLSGRRWARARVGNSSPGSGEAEGEGGEDFYIGRCPDLLVITSPFFRHCLRSSGKLYQYPFTDGHQRATYESRQCLERGMDVLKLHQE
jgi:hypothetical protein